MLATPAALEPLVALAGVADELLDARGLEPLRWPGPAPDLAVNLHGKGPQSHQLLLALEPGRLAAFGSAPVGYAGPRWRPDEHEVHRWCRMLEESLDIPADPTDLALPRPAPTTDAATETTGVVVLHPGAAYPSRRWPPERFAAVARWAVGRGYRVVLTGGSDEVALAQAVQRLADLPDASVVAGRTDPAELAALVASAGLVVCGDTGVAHLATAFGTPSVLLFGPTPPTLWGPPADGPHTVLWHGTSTGDPWRDEVDPALLEIGVDEVLDAVELRLPTGPARRTTRGCA